MLLLEKLYKLGTLFVEKVRKTKLTIAILWKNVKVKLDDVCELDMEKSRKDIKHKETSFWLSIMSESEKLWHDI